MRTVEQVVADFKDADTNVKKYEQIREKFRKELEEILSAAEAALGIEKKPIYHSPLDDRGYDGIGGDGRI